MKARYIVSIGMLFIVSAMAVIYSNPRGPSIDEARLVLVRNVPIFREVKPGSLQLKTGNSKRAKLLKGIPDGTPIFPFRLTTRLTFEGKSSDMDLDYLIYKDDFGTWALVPPNSEISPQ